jgi:hypothetical protein
MLMIILFVVVDGTIDSKKNRFLKNSWLKVALAIAAIVALGTYSDYKGIYLFPVLKIYSTD